MRSALQIVGPVLLILGTATGVRAQECRKLLCAPTFSFQPGVAVFNAIGAPTVNADGDRAASSTEFLFRVATIMPSSVPRLSMLAVVWWTPFMTTSASNASGRRVKVTNNAPNFLIGPSFLLYRHGPSALQFAVVDGYRRWEKPDDDGDIDSYRHNLILIPSVNVRVGALMGATAPALLRSVGAYAIWQQQVTNMPFNIGPDGKSTGERAYPPGLFFGLTVPLAPTP